MRTLISSLAGWLPSIVLVVITIVCIALLFPKVQSSLAAEMAAPRLSIPKNIPADPESLVDIPVRFTSNDNNIASLVFSIDYEQAWLNFDDNASDAILFDLPDDFTGSCNPDTDDSDGELDCFVLDPLPPLASLPDGVFLTVKLRTKNPPGGVTARVGFSASSPPASFGNDQGQSVPGTTVDGSVDIAGGGPPILTPWAFLPGIFKHFSISPIPPTPTITPTVTPTITPAPKTPTPPVCYDLILNGDMEGNTGWEFPITSYSAGYSTVRNHTPGGSRSIRTGIDPPSVNIYSYSSAGQLLLIPDSAKSADLSLWIYPISSEAVLAQSLPALKIGIPFVSQPLNSDLQYVLVLDYNYEVIGTLLAQVSNSQTWTLKEYDLMSFKGQWIRLWIGTFNDGIGGISSMYVDDVALDVCP